jgi:predicted nucleic acid-binding protein
MSDTVLYYLDTNAFSKYYVLDKSDTPEGEEVQRRAQERIRALATANAPLYISNLTHLEFLGTLMKKCRDHKLKYRAITKILDQLEKDIGSEAYHRFQIIPVQAGIFSEARRLMVSYGKNYALGTNDALHIVMAKTFSPEMTMVTSDGGKSDGKMKGVCRELGLNILDPEQYINNLSSG